MSAMTSIFKIPIQVIQADSPVVNIGEQFQQDPLVLMWVSVFILYSFPTL